jgi:predicted amidohydrolase YtcJ
LTSLPTGRNIFAALCAFAGAFVAPASAQTVAANAPAVILTGGKIFTADSTHPWAEALAIRGERIVAVGTSAEMRRLATRTTRDIPLNGRVVVPGFNDAHDHLGAADFGFSFTTSPSPKPEPTLPVVLDSLRALVRRTPPGTWLHTTVGTHFLEDTTVGRAVLDRVAPRHPVMLRAWTGHGLVLNSAAIRALRIPEDVRDPVAGTYERDASGRLTGVLQEYAQWAVQRRLYSEMPQRDLVRYFRRNASEAACLGLTSVQDMNGDLDPKTTVRVLREAQLPIRLRVIPFPMTNFTGPFGAEWDGVDAHPAPRTVVSGVKWILDGTPLDRNALMRSAYADRAGWHGQLDFTPAMIRGMLSHALATRQPLHLHIVGDSSARLVLGMMQALAPGSVWRPLRVRIEHGDGVSGDLLPVAKRLGVVIVQNPAHFAFEPGMLEHRFGSRPAGFQAVRSILAAGIPLAIGSDGPRNPFLNIMFATTHPNNPAEALTREQVVTAYTLGSAFAEFAEHDKGMLKPGMLADLAVLSQDIFTIPAQALPATTSVLTMVGGKVVCKRNSGMAE